MIQSYKLTENIPESGGNSTYALSLNAPIDVGYLVLIDAKYSLLLSAFVVDFHNVELFVLHKVHVADGLTRHEVSRQIGSILHRILHYSRCVCPLLSFDLNEIADKMSYFR